MNMTKNKQRLILTIFLMSSVFFVCTGCKQKLRGGNEAINDAIYRLSKELPIRLEGLGIVQKINFDDNSVIFLMRIKEEISSGLNVTKINEKGDLAKKIVLTQIKRMDDQIKDAIKSIGEQGYSLKVHINGTESKRTGVIKLSSNEILTAVSQPLEISEEDYSLLMISLTTKMMLPTKVDEVTTWTETIVTDNSFEYVYSINDKYVDMTLADKTQMKIEKENMLIQHLNLMQNVISKCISSHRKLIYRYIGSQSGISLDIVFSEKELKEIMGVL